MQQPVRARTWSLRCLFKRVATGTKPDEHKDEGLLEPTGLFSKCDPVWEN